MFSITAGLVAALLATANAHMFIQSPTPIDGTAPKDPIESSGANFPCHGVSLPSSGGEKMAAGSSQLLAWNLDGGLNTAVHGGGSCQISITYETDPTAVKNPDNWYVIYSIEGGCPSNTMGNLDGSYSGSQGTYTGAISCADPKANGIDCVNEFNFTIPTGVKNGHAIMAWTWYNTIGNRELYMNCINTQITGGDGSEMSELPSMFVANVPTVNRCKSDENYNVKFPYPGKYETTKGPAAAASVTYSILVPTVSGIPGVCDNLGAPVGGNIAPTPTQYAGGQPPAGPSSPAASGPPSGSGAPSGSAAPPSYGASSRGAAGSGLITVTTLQTVTSGGASASTPASTSAPASSAPAPSASAPAASGSAPAAPSSYAPAPTGSSTGTGSCPASGVSCTNPGGVVCIGASQWGLCDINNCAVPQALAAGTHCTDGKVLKRDHMCRHAAKHLRHGH